MMTFETFRQQFSLRLDKQQEAAVCQTEGPVLLLAVPGSGKTTALLARIGYLLYCRQVPPESVLTVTYTVAATADLRRRFSETFGEEYATRLEFRTINGMCARIIRQFEQMTGRQAFQLVSDETESTRLVREAWKQANRGFPTDSDLEESKTRIAYCKNSMLSDDEIQQLEDGEQFFKLFDAYRKLLLDNRLMDYDDQMVYGLKILRSQPQLLQAWQQKYRYFHVDEAQDTSKIQHEIIRLLASHSRNLFMVGDEDQSIYGFRAAYPQALMSFQTDWPEHCCRSRGFYPAEYPSSSQADGHTQSHGQAGGAPLAAPSVESICCPCRAGGGRGALYRAVPQSRKCTAPHRSAGKAGNALCLPGRKSGIFYPSHRAGCGGYFAVCKAAR